MESRDVIICYSTTDIDESGVRLQDRHEFEGSLLEKDSMIYVSYKTSDEEGHTSHVLLKISEDRMNYKLSGTYSSDMEFNPGIKKPCNYCTPLGNIPMHILTEKYDFEKDCDEITAFVKYKLMGIDMSHMADREMKIKVKYK